MATTTHDKDKGDRNADAITGEPGSHPVGAGIGAAGGAAAGAAIGLLGGPVGAAMGALIGGLLGGGVGKGVAEWIDPTEEHAYWRDEYKKRDYTKDEYDYDRYGPAYAYGWESYSRYGKHSGGQYDRFEDVDAQLGEAWNTHRGDSDLSWDDARDATRESWQRTHQRGAAAKA